MIPAPITQISELSEWKQIKFEQIKREVQTKNYDHTLEEVLINLFLQNMIKDANIAQLVKYCAHKDMGIQYLPESNK